MVPVDEEPDTLHTTTHY